MPVKKVPVAADREWEATSYCRLPRSSDACRCALSKIKPICCLILACSHVSATLEHNKPESHLFTQLWLSFSPILFLLISLFFSPFLSMYSFHNLSLSFFAISTSNSLSVSLVFILNCSRSFSTSVAITLFLLISLCPLSTSLSIDISLYFFPT